VPTAEAPERTLALSGVTPPLYTEWLAALFAVTVTAAKPNSDDDHNTDQKATTGLNVGFRLHADFLSDVILWMHAANVTNLVIAKTTGFRY